MIFTKTLLSLAVIGCLASEPVEPEIPTYAGYSEYEIDLMAAVVYLEAGNQDMIGKCLVVDAILNRFDSKHFPDTIVAVIEQPGQFTTSKRAHELVEKQLIPYDCYGAVLKEIYNRSNYEVIYFAKGFGCGEPMFKYGDHCFSSISRRLK